MEYRYDGDAHSRLFGAYSADSEPFPVDISVCFPTQNHQREEFGLIRELLFPTCWNAPALVRDELAVLERVDRLGEIFLAGICPYQTGEAERIVRHTLDALPRVRELVKLDVEAAYKGDPAAKSYTEVIRAYPGLLAVMIQRIGHVLYHEGAPEYARELTEHAKVRTGIDIHPGAVLGPHLFIDHGTGVVIGESATVGSWVRLYQDVTLGALHFEPDEGDAHTLKKGYKRHPDIGDHVVIGAGAKVLGAVSVGDHASIGANSWVTEDIPPHTSVFIKEHPSLERKPKT
jgi:serine O-acetyltransferase